MSKWIPIVIAAVAIAGCDSRAGEPKAVRGWVRLPAVQGQAGAGYLTLIGGAGNDRLVQVESALVERIELHESMKHHGGMVGMRALESVDVPSGATVRFEPGGKHLMLFGIDKVVTPGTAIPIRLGFASGRTAEAEAKTVAAGEDAPY